MINMFVLIVIEQFEHYFFNPENPINSFEDITDKFRKIWSMYSDLSGRKIKSSNIYYLFITLESPLGYFTKKVEGDITKYSK